MSHFELASEIFSLPEKEQKEIAALVKRIQRKKKLNNPIKERKYGAMKGFFRMHENFDDPLPEFASYM